jgi:DNA-binding response OmpR family regulator
MKILIVEDDAEMASAIARHLHKNAMLADAVGNLHEAGAALALNAYQLVLLDRQLPDGDGASFVAAARLRCPGIPIIMLTALGGTEQRIAGLDHGADDYLAKPFSVDELMARIRAIMRRPAQVELEYVELANVSYDIGSRQAYVDGSELSLPRRQLLVLEALIMRQGRVVSRAALEQAVYGLDDLIESNSLEAHVSKLRRALVERGACVSIHAVRGLGYIMREESEAKP